MTMLRASEFVFSVTKKPRGTGNWLTPEEVKAIQSETYPGGNRMAWYETLGDKYGCNPKTVQRIVLGLTRRKG